MKSQDLFVGIDVGGTAIKVGFVLGNGPVENFATCPTPQSGNPNDLLDLMSKHVWAISSMQKQRPTAVGVVLAGAVNGNTGMVDQLPNIAGWQLETPMHVSALLEQRLDTLVVIENDANGAALAEWLYGAGQGKKHLMVFTLGTGIGAGFILNNQLYRGTHGYAAEPGHIEIGHHIDLCSCGLHGCWETTPGSGKGLARLAQAKLQTPSDFTDYVIASGIPFEEVSAKTVADATRKGSKVARGLLRTSAYYLGKGMALLVTVLNPEMIVVRGGLTKSWDLIEKRAIATMRGHAMRTHARNIPVVTGTVPDSGIVGAIALAQQSIYSLPL